MRSGRNRLARRSALAFLATLVLLLPSSALHAHSAPGVAAIVDEDANRIYVVRLYEGHAQHTPDGWRFLCSGLYQGVGTEISAALPGGGVAIAARQGIWVLKRDGTIGPHPDPQAKGYVTAFARGGGKLYGIQQRSNGAFDVIEVTADAVRVLWTDSRYWSDLAVGDTLIQLVRIDGDVIEELQLSLAGEVLSEQDALVIDAQAVNARMLGDTAYYTVRLETRVQLGQIQQNAWQVLQTAASSIAGPSRTADGVSFVALDGKLARFGVDTPAVAEMDFVTGLNRLDDHSYACTRTGLRNLSSAGLGDSVFDLSRLLPPDPCIVPENARPSCELEWQHVQVELLGASIPIAQASAPSQCTPGSGAVADAGAADASLDLDGAVGAVTGSSSVGSGSLALPDGGASVADAADAQPSMSKSGPGGGCNVAGPGHRAWAAWVVLLLCLYPRRWRRDAKFTAALLGAREVLPTRQKHGRIGLLGRWNRHVSRDWLNLAGGCCRELTFDSSFVGGACCLPHLGRRL